jgi:hypothetical protein
MLGLLSADGRSPIEKGACGTALQSIDNRQSKIGNSNSRGEKQI